ncbi:hypothetical protein PG990_004099 [Apiospora arundinis]
MKYLVALSLLAGSLAAVDQEPAPLDENGVPFSAEWVQVAETSYYCYADNCARAVTGTRTAADMPAQSVRRADCSSYMQTTVTPPPVTTTITTTGTVTSSPYTYIPSSTSPGKRAVAAATIPPYASFCTEAFPGATPHYSSACNCWGITAATTTLPPSTVTQTATATYTAPIQSKCPSPGSCKGGFSATPCYGNHYCVCLQDTEGNAVCVHTSDSGGCGQPDSKYCSKSADCPAGEVCTTSFCCGNPGVCAAYVDKGNCPNTNSARFIFAKRRAAAALEEKEETQLEEPAAFNAAAAPPPTSTSSMCQTGPCEPTNTNKPPSFAAKRGLVTSIGAEAAAPPLPTTTSSMCQTGPCSPKTI